MQFMSRKHKRQQQPSAAAPKSPDLWDRLARPRTIFAGFVLAVVLFYWVPLFTNPATIQWDAVDVTYSAQRYLASLLHSGRLAFWTPYVFSGMPLLADPQVGAWYPLNWPFFLLGVTPRAIEGELALHALLAALGAYLLARDLLRSRAAAVFAALFFAFSGLFAETSSHPGPFQATAWLPALLWAARRATRSPRWLPALAIASGCLVLTGHFQTALYCFFALAVFLAADCYLDRVPWKRWAGALIIAALAAAALPAVMTIPGLELSSESIRAGADYSRDPGAALVPGALATLLSPDHLGALDPPGGYTGPPALDITQSYLYMGLLLVPMAIAGAAAATRARWLALALVIPGAWFAFGPPAGLYSVIALLPGFRSLRAPIQMWFVAALGIALLAGAGIDWLGGRFRSPWIVAALLLFTAGDLYYWNMYRNPLAFARENFDDRYGVPQARFQQVMAPYTADPMHRIYSPTFSPSFGPFNSTLDTRIEVTWGYNPLELWRYSKYMEAAGTNTQLLNGLGITALINLNNGSVRPNSARLPRIYAPAAVAAVATKEEALARISALVPAREAVAEGIAPIPDNGGANVQITAYEGDLYRARYQAAHPTLLRIAVPWFPGWQAEVDGHQEKLVPVDLALMGVVVPAGSHELVVRYHANRFVQGLAISLAAWLVAIGAAVWGVASFRRHSAGAPKQQQPSL
jgi:hypothetical protein